MLPTGWPAGSRRTTRPNGEHGSRDPTPTPSSAPSSLVHCTMTIGEARAQYMDRVRQMREEQFREAQADTAYNHHLLQEHLQAEEQIASERAE